MRPWGLNRLCETDASPDASPEPALKAESTSRQSQARPYSTSLSMLGVCTSRCPLLSASLCQPALAQPSGGKGGEPTNDQHIEAGLSRSARSVCCDLVEGETVARVLPEPQSASRHVLPTGVSEPGRCLSQPTVVDQ